MILVVGATGQLGGLITRTLLARGEAVRVLTRAGSAYDDLLAARAQPVMGDLKDAPSLAAACAGVDAVVTTATGAAGIGDDTVEAVDRLGNRRLIDAAASAGVRRFVFTSVLGADAGSPMPQPISWRDVVAAFERELDRALDVRTVPPGAPIPGLPDIVTGLVTFLNTYDSPIDSADLATAYGVVPTPLTEFVRGFVLASRGPLTASRDAAPGRQRR
jgi:hypothetical protein